MSIKIYTDGSATPTRSGIGVFFGLNDPRNISEEISGTNQYAELYAIYKALSSINPIKYLKVTICTDSMYSINCITKWIDNWKVNNWKTSKNKDVKHKELIQKIDKLVKNNVFFKHVNSHRKEPSLDSNKWVDWFGNDYADKLALGSI